MQRVNNDEKSFLGFHGVLPALDALLRSPPSSFLLSYQGLPFPASSFVHSGPDLQDPKRARTLLQAMGEMVMLEVDEKEAIRQAVGQLGYSLSEIVKWQCEPARDCRRWVGIVNGGLRVPPIPT